MPKGKKMEIEKKYGSNLIEKKTCGG